MNFQQLCQKLNNVYSKLKQNKQISTRQIKQSKDKDLRTKMKNFPWKELISSYPNDDASKIKKIAESINQRYWIIFDKSLF